MAEKNYAQQRASVLENLDGLRVEVDTEKRIGYLILDREPLNIVSYTGRQQIRAIIEEMDEDDDVGVIVMSVVARLISQSITLGFDSIKRMVGEITLYFSSSI